jgi:hypothetical protein
MLRNHHGERRQELLFAVGHALILSGGRFMHATGKYSRLRCVRRGGAHWHRIADLRSSACTQ